MALTPMMRQYLEIKEKYEDTILFFRLGDFYEMFMEDAKIASSILEIALTGRDAGLEERIPMCGIPYHAANSYIKKLIDKGHKVAICEQVEDPKTTKGIVKREVIKVITPGTVLDENSLVDKENLYIGAVVEEDDVISFAYADISTGEFKVVEVLNFIEKNKIIDEINRLDLKELVVISEEDKDRFSYLVGFITVFTDIEKDVIDCLGGEKSIPAANLLYNYLNFTQKGNIGYIDKLEVYTLDNFMIIDSWTRKNLEIIRNLRTGETTGSLLGVLDKTKTAFGGRLLKKWLEEPLLKERILKKGKG